MEWNEFYHVLVGKQIDVYSAWRGGNVSDTAELEDRTVGGRDGKAVCNTDGISSQRQNDSRSGWRAGRGLRVD
ncbi:hypothetical protein E4U53_003742 [Claviceps sorghi]|nr:hypothetical protein E4U53_003742 [Claviceps sorghi]